MSTDMDEVVGEFLVESYENLDQFDRDLVELEEHPDFRDVLDSIFRTIHTVKGTCGFLGFGRLEAVAHAGENLLSLLRDGQLAMGPDIASALLAMGDAVRGMLATIEASGGDGDGDGDGDHAELIATLVRLQSPDAAPAAAAPEVPSAPRPEPRSPAAPPATLRIGEILAESGSATPEAWALADAEQARGDTRPLGEILVDHGAVTEEKVREALRTQADPRPGGGVADSTIRVDVGLLDSLMTLVGELVLARNQIVQVTSEREDPSLQASAQRLNLITTELQAAVMKTRMQPVGNVWSKFPRVVRDLARACAKQVRIEMEGGDTELDKTIIEAIKDPLTHLVRNAVDHGVEPPEVRVAAGKAPEGVLLLRAYHEGGQVNVEISDDGGGIDAARLRRKAVEKGLLTAEAAERLSEREALLLIFSPGFSTAEAVTNVSGRGVGMDVVKTNIERIGGTIDVQTTVGRGTALKVKIPLTLAIIPALVVTTGGERH